MLRIVILPLSKTIFMNRPSATDIKINSGRRLRLLRIACGPYTQEEFGELIGIKGNYLSMIEVGDRSIPKTSYYDIVRSTNVTLDWLLLGIETNLPLGLSKKIAEAEGISN